MRKNLFIEEFVIVFASKMEENISKLLLYL